MAMCKNDDKPPHQKFFLLQAKEVYLYTFDPQKKALNLLLQNIYLLFDLLYDKTEPPYYDCCRW